VFNPKHMKKSRRAKQKITPKWQEEKYSPSMVLRAMPHTGETRIIRNPFPKALPPTPQEKRPAA
jgi:hypothetical protein